jgi:hypothetical protein
MSRLTQGVTLINLGEAGTCGLGASSGEDDEDDRGARCLNSMTPVRAT